MKSIQHFEFVLILWLCSPISDFQVTVHAIPNVSIYTSTVSSNVTNLPIDLLLSGNTILENAYAALNQTGIQLVGGVLLAVGGLFALTALPSSSKIKSQITSFRNGISSYVPSKGYSAPAKDTVTYSYDEDGYFARNDKEDNSFHTGYIPGPPYKHTVPPTILYSTTTAPQKIYIHVDQKKNAVPVVNTITNALKSSFTTSTSYPPIDRIDTEAEYDDYYLDDIDQAFFDYAFNNVLSNQVPGDTRRNDNYSRFYKRRWQERPRYNTHNRHKSTYRRQRNKYHDYDFIKPWRRKKKKEPTSEKDYYVNMY